MQLIKTLLKDGLTWCCIALGVLSLVISHIPSALKLFAFDGHTTLVVGGGLAIVLIIMRAVTLNKQPATPPAPK